MIIYSLIFAALNLFSVQGIADEGEGTINPAAEDLVSVKKFRLDNKVGDVFVIVRKDGHMDGHPYIVELRPSCGPEVKEWKNLNVADSQSACAVVPNTEKMNTAKKEVLVRLHEANGILYNVNSMKAAVNGKAMVNDPQCSPTAQDFKFDLSEFCNKKRK